MRVRRYYPKGFKGKTYSDEYLAKLEERGVDVDLIDNAKTEFILDKEEEKIAYQQCVERIMTQTREVLDTLESAPEFKVSWENYRKKLRPSRKPLELPKNYL